MEYDPARYYPNDNLLGVAVRAFESFAHGWATGDFQPYIEMLAGEMEFLFPDGDQAGHFHGRNGRERMIAKCRNHSDAGERLILHQPHHITAGHGTVLFEFVAESIPGHPPFKGAIAIAFDVDGGSITGFREYYGYVYEST
jgi:hypothetical protein